jgi:hypothetical protein
MAFWQEVATGFLGNVFAGVLLVIVYVLIQWFLAATDISIRYNWRFDGTTDAPRNMRPNFDIRNRSRSRTYFLANVGYLNNQRPVAPFDNKSVWGRELKPGTIEFVEAAPVTGVTSLTQCFEMEVHVYLQNGRSFWLKGTGPGQLRVGKIQQMAFWLRKKLEAGAVPTE